ELPRTLHVDEPSPHVDWSAGTVRLLTESREWSSDGPRRAGVSSFGISGTNAHLILEQAPEEERPPAVETVAPLLLSARSPEALRDQAARLHAHLTARPDIGAGDVAYTLTTARTAFRHRAAVLGTDREALLTGLQALTEGREAPGVVRGKAVTKSRTAFLFTGQGAQRVGMGRELYEAFPVFAAALDELCGHLDPLLGRSLSEVMFDGPAEMLDRTAFTQPALFAYEVALFRLVEAYGVRPDVLIGHSVGELAAAHVAGVLSAADACVLVAARGQLMEAATSGGAMVAVRAPAEEVAASLPEDGRVAIAAVNSPGSTVVSGDAEAVAATAAHWRGRGARVRPLSVSHAFHSAHMDPALDKFRGVAATVEFRPPTLPVISDLSGEEATAEQLTSPDYWTRHIRETVRFADCVRAAEAHGVTAFLEIGPDEVLAPLAAECLSADALSADVLTAPAVRRDRSETQSLIAALCRLHLHGVAVDRSVLVPRAGTVELPTYAFQRRRYWLRDTAAGPGEWLDGWFWMAVENGDTGALVDTLGLTAEQVGSAEALLTAARRWREDTLKAVAVLDDPPPAGDTREAVADGVPRSPDALAEWLAGYDRAGRERLLLSLVRTTATEVLALPGPDDLDPEADFLDVGFSSLTAVELRNRLCAVTGLPLPPSVIYDLPTSHVLAAYLEEKLGEREAAGEPTLEATA
ncbi:acyltransferase domain-containing protein, partial [Streptomyces sp. NPDC052043]|uniref:acyltransferase domain-containing protein n=1 Tax=Streptomyces sp. NPDC052043 TaxID=3365684 RepID=UPI0037CDC960